MTGGARGWSAALAALVMVLPFACSGGSKVSGGPGSSGGSAGASGGSGGKSGGAGAASGASGSSAGGTGAGAAGRGGAGAASGGAGAGAGDSGGAGASGGAGGAGDAGEGGFGGGGSCEDVVATATLVPATVTLLVDSSSSMWETMPPAWTPLYQALMDPTFGVVPGLEDRIRFGFAAFRGSAVSTPEDDASCAAWTTVPAALDNYGEVDASYAAIEWPETRPKWLTPTGHAIRRASSDLLAEPAPGQKAILLITDGNPNTCVLTDPKCGQDNSIRATQDAHAAGVLLFVVGVGDIISQPNVGCPTSARCGTLHLQDLANAGMGAPVRPPPGCDDPSAAECAYRYEACHPGNMLTASYTPNAPDTGVPLALDTASSPTPASLSTAIADVLAPLVPCTLELDVTVTGNPARSTVLVADTPVPFEGSARGFTLGADERSITLTGSACDDFRAGAPLAVTFHCDAAAVPRP